MNLGKFLGLISKNYTPHCCLVFITEKKITLQKLLNVMKN